MKAAREAWFEGQPDLDPERPVFLDETWTLTNMGRRHGRSPRGERLRSGVPHGHWKPVIAVALTEAGQDTVAADITVMKKSLAAAKAAQVLAGTGWLPPVLRRAEAVTVNDNGPVAPWQGDDAEADEEAA